MPKQVVESNTRTERLITRWVVSVFAILGGVFGMYEPLTDPLVASVLLGILFGAILGLLSAVGGIMILDNIPR